MLLRRVRDYTLVLSIACLAWTISSVYAACLTPTCHQTKAEGRPASGDCSEYDPWLICTGGWWTRINEGTPIQAANPPESIDMIWCPSCDGLCPDKPGTSGQEVTNLKRTLLRKCDTGTFDVWDVACTNPGG